MKRAVAFIDGQNLFHGARETFGYTFPNYDVQALALAVCRSQGWGLGETRFYTGVPDHRDDPFWNQFWAAKFLSMSRRGVAVFHRPLRYREEEVRLPDGSKHSVRVGKEKGIDVRIAIDIIRHAHQRAYDVALIFSQDQDLSEVAQEIKTISREQGRWIKVASAFPDSPTAGNHRGINGTDWIRIDRGVYETCIDPNHYGPRR